MDQVASSSVAENADAIRIKFELSLADGLNCHPQEAHSLPVSMYTVSIPAPYMDRRICRWCARHARVDVHTVASVGQQEHAGSPRRALGFRLTLSLEAGRRTYPLYPQNGSTTGGVSPVPCCERSRFGVMWRAIFDGSAFLLLTRTLPGKVNEFVLWLQAEERFTGFLVVGW
jgi:hypothetical protein